MTAASNTIETVAPAKGLNLRQRRQAVLQQAGRKQVATTSDPESAKTTAALMLSELAFKPLLSEMRKLPFGKGIMDGGRGEEVFGEQLDQQIADVVALSDTGGLATEFAKHLDPTQRYKANAGPGSDNAYWRLQEQLQTTNSNVQDAVDQ